MKAKRLTVALMLVGLIPVSGGTAVQAQAAYPNKPIEMILTVPPGGVGDLVARLIVKPMSAHLGQPVVVVNRGGAAGTIGTALAARAPKDGYTLLLAVDSHSSGPSLFRNLSYDAQKDFAAVGLLGTVPMALVGGPALPATNMRELVRLLKEKPNFYSYASTGVGTQTHLPGRLLESAAGVSMLHVPYAGGGPAISDLLGGHVSMMFASLTTAAKLSEKKGVKLIAVAASQRSNLFPEIPTMAEAGYPQVDMDMWFGILAPAGTPEPVISTLNSTINSVLREPEIKERLAQLQITAKPGTPSEFASFLEKDIAKRSELIGREGITPTEPN